MRAAVLRQGRLVVDEIVGPPAPRDGQVVVEVLANGICGTDLHLTSDLDGWFEATERAGDTIKLFDRHRETVLGHEFAGRVVELGGDVTRVEVGDLVYCVPIVFDDTGSMKCLGFSDTYPGGSITRLVGLGRSPGRSRVTDLLRPLAIPSLPRTAIPIPPTGAPWHSSGRHIDPSRTIGQQLSRKRS